MQYGDILHVKQMKNIWNLTSYHIEISLLYHIKYKLNPLYHIKQKLDHIIYYYIASYYIQFFLLHFKYSSRVSEVE